MQRSTDSLRFLGFLDTSVWGQRFAPKRGVWAVRRRRAEVEVCGLLEGSWDLVSKVISRLSLG